MTVPKVIGTELEGLLLLEPLVHGDDRGFLVETYRAGDWAKAGVDCKFVQTNHSRSVRGVVRGMHFQRDPGQAKLIRCAGGRIFDVAVDIRPDSPTFGRWEAHELDDESHRQLFIPPGFAHGFCVLSQTAEVIYNLSSYYDPATEAGFAWDDPEVGIKWPFDEPQISERDRDAPHLSELALSQTGSRGAV